ncbi:MAG: sugar phosphate nucleotidyltransferase [Dehalococcoidia bacterium]|nr:glucose-1-phosphate adenylyltransferase [Dehalococcoidia bacterium]MDO8636242.1 sugar phosphate nucleotidyltransferase [Dehalococcoidia bacterium]
MESVLAIILAGGTGNRLSILSEERAKPAVPFAGKYRIIDFVLSNCVNSGIYNVGVATQYNPRSLMEHIGVGRPWGLDRSHAGARLLQPYRGREGGDWYRDTGDAVFQNLYFIAEQKVDQVLILAGDHIYTMRYDVMLNFHRQRNADVTIGLVEVDPEETSRFGIVTLDHMNRVREFKEKPKVSDSNLASMGIYIFNKETLIEVMERMGGKETLSDFGGDIIPSMVGKYKVYGVKVQSYWRDVGTIEAYWKASMDLIVDLPPLNLYDPELTIMTAVETSPPVKIGPYAKINRSLLCNGCIINGEVKNSILSPGVYVEEGARVEDSVVFFDSVIGRGAVVEKSIIDKQCWVGPGAYIGYGGDYTPNQEEPEHLNCGITLVGKGARVPEGTKIGRNCKIDCWVEPEDFKSDFVPSGASITKKTPRRFHV